MLAPVTGGCRVCGRAVRRAGLALGWHARLASSSPSRSRRPPDERRSGSANGGSPSSSQRKATPQVAYHSSPRGLASAALSTAAADPQARWLRRRQGQQQGIPPPVLVPAVPPLDSFAELGPDVVAPRPGVFRPLRRDLGRAYAEPLVRRTGLTLRVSSKHVVHPWMMRYLEGTPLSAVPNPAQNSDHSHMPLPLPHCLAALFHRRYAAQHAQAPLWWMVLVHNRGKDEKPPPAKARRLAGSGSGSGLPPAYGAYVRNTLKKRVQRAMRAALQRRGYDEQGRPLEGGGRDGSDGSDGSDSTAAPPKRTLRGTVRLEGSVAPLVPLRYGELVEQLETVVEALEQVLAVPPVEGDGRRWAQAGARTDARTTSWRELKPAVFGSSSPADTNTRQRHGHHDRT